MHILKITMVMILILLAFPITVNAKENDFCYKFIVGTKDNISETELNVEDFITELKIGWQFKTTDVDCFMWMDLTKSKVKKTTFPKCGFARVEVGVKYKDKYLEVMPGSKYMQIIDLAKLDGDLMFDDIKVDVTDKDDMYFVEIFLSKGYVGCMFSIRLVDVDKGYETWTKKKLFPKFSNCWYRGKELDYYADFASLDTLSAVEEMKKLGKYEELNKMVEF